MGERKLWIDQYRQDDGYYADEDDVHHGDTPEDCIRSMILNWCGCGCPKDALNYVKKVLKGISMIYKDENYGFRGFEKEFPDSGARYTILYVLDERGLTDHGTSVPGFLTEKGKEILKDLEQLSLEDKE